MKIIISTKVFAENIRFAVASRCETFRINPNSELLTFDCSNEISCVVHILGKNMVTRIYNFDTVKMFKILNILDILQEQPIVVEFNQFEDDGISVKLSGFEYWF